MKLPFNIDLNDKVVVITGAGGVICSHLAKAIAKCGAKVCLLDLNLDSAKTFANEIENSIVTGIEESSQVTPKFSLDEKSIEAKTLV